MSQTIAICLRGSTESQDVASQQPELRRWAAQQEGEIRWYLDRFTSKTNVLASVATYETEVRAERILAGQPAARARGKAWGGTKRGRRIKVNGVKIQLIHQMKAEGEMVASIARATGLSRPTIYDVLKTEPAPEKN